MGAGASNMVTTNYQSKILLWGSLVKCVGLFVGIFKWLDHFRPIVLWLSFRSTPRSAKIVKRRRSCRSSGSGASKKSTGSIRRNWSSTRWRASSWRHPSRRRTRRRWSESSNPFFRPKRIAPICCWAAPSSSFSLSQAAPSSLSQPTSSSIGTKPFYFCPFVHLLKQGYSLYLPCILHMTYTD